MDSSTIAWKPIPLIQAHHFFNYTITYTPIGSGTQKRQTPMVQTLSYSNCTTGCSLTLLELPVDVVYTVTVTITRSTNPGVSGEQDKIALSIMCVNSCCLFHVYLFLFSSCRSKSAPHHYYGKLDGHTVTHTHHMQPIISYSYSIYLHVHVSMHVPLCVCVCVIVIYYYYY